MRVMRVIVVETIVVETRTLLLWSMMTFKFTFCLLPILLLVILLVRWPVS